MIHDEVSIVRQREREEKFWPSICPRSRCSGTDFNRHGENSLKRFPYFSLRFLCLTCGSTFTSSVFRLDYCQKSWGHNKEIFLHHRLGISRRESARQIGHSEKLVRGRLIKMARRGLLLHAKLSGTLPVDEPIVYDGLENFSFSQYQPNNINHVVGKETLFTYDFNFSPLNRKGRMSERQRRIHRKLNEKFGKFPQNSIRESTSKILRRMFTRMKSPVLYSDRHYAYEKSVRMDLKKFRVTHYRVSSKIARNFKNHLFAVNNVDMQARHNLSAFKRETIAFSKHTVAMQESFLLYVIFRNYMRPKFWGTHRSDPETSKKSPAMYAGITNKILSFDEFFGMEVLPKEVKLNEDQKRLYQREDPYSRQKIWKVA